MIQALGWLLLLGAFFLEVALEGRRADKEEREPAPPSEPPPEWIATTLVNPVTHRVYACVTNGAAMAWGNWNRVTCEIDWQCDVSDVPEDILELALGKVIQRATKVAA